VVVSSGYSDDPIMSDPLKYGFVAAISKPYQIKDLTKIVSSVLKN
jgi:FixJ family two-component response regulator